MITIMPADKAFLDSVGASTDTEAMVLRERDGTVTGHALFRIMEDTIEILKVTANEPLMISALIRAVLGAGEYRGAATGLCRVASLEPVLRSLEFQPAEKGYCIKIADFFHGKCPGEQENTCH